MSLTAGRLRSLLRAIKNFSPRSSVVASTVAQFAMKPIGYVRILLIAYFFGASAGVDSFHIASGAVGLAMGIALSIVQVAILPSLMKLSSKDDEAARSFFAHVVRFVLLWGGIIFVLLMVFPKEYIWLFAANLDPASAETAKNMLMLLLPMGYIQLLGGLLGVWANYKGNYSLVAIVNAPASPAALILLIILIPFIGVYAIAVSLSISIIIFTAATFYILRDIPTRPKIKVPSEVLKKTGKDAIMCVGMLGAGIFYGVTDRWFAAGLPVGNVSAISYASQIVSLMMLFTATASQIHLTHSSKVSENKELLADALNKSLSIGWAYMMPLALAAAALAVPAVKIIFGYGAFDETAVALTAPCFAIQAIVVPLTVWSMIMGNYGLATSRLKFILWVSYISVILNILLDWLFTPIWGAAGICAATSLNQGTLGLYYIYRLAPKGTFSRQIPPIIPQMIFGAAWAVFLYLISDNVITSIILGGFFVVAHLFVSEYFGWFRELPRSWLPSSMSLWIFGQFSKIKRKS